MTTSDLLRDAAMTETGTLRSGEVRIGDVEVVVAEWDFTVAGGSCGVEEADGFIAAVDRAIATGRPLLTLLASGGTRLTEGMRALVGIPRMVLALDRLRAARLPHVSVAFSPTTGGVWVAVGCAADLRIGLSGATIAFTGPRVVEAMTGVPPGPGAGTASAAFAHGLLDAEVDPADLTAAVERALAAVVPAGSGCRCIEACDGTPSAPADAGAGIVWKLLRAPVELRGADGSVRAAVGRVHVAGSCRPAVAVAAAAAAHGLVTAAGFRLIARAAGLADALDAPLLLAVDTIGGDPHDETTPPEILAATRAVLGCRAPTLSLVHGAGGSGGALAAAVTDVVAVGGDGWFAALAPAGAQAALRRPLEEVLEAMRPGPAELLADGFADVVYPAGTEAAVVAEVLPSLLARSATERLAARSKRWSAALRQR